MEERTLFSVRVAASYMGWSMHHTRKMMEWGEIPYIKQGRRYFISKEDLDAFVEKNRRAYREYSWCRVKQHGAIGNARDEHLNYYLKWLKEKGAL